MRVVILGATGAAGRAVAGEFVDAEWEVVGTGRDPRWFPAGLQERGVRFIAADRHDAGALRGVLADGADLVVDCVCFCAQHARALLEHRQLIGSVVMLSSKAVYVDRHGHHSNSDSQPRFDGPVSEQQPLLEPDFSGAYAGRHGYGPNKVAAELTLLDSDLPVSILRPSLIYGPGSRQPREWFVVKRLLDGRERIPLSHQGQTANHPTAAVNLARVVARCALAPAPRIVNVADPGARPRPTWFRRSPAHSTGPWRSSASITRHQPSWAARRGQTGRRSCLTPPPRARWAIRRPVATPSWSPAPSTIYAASVTRSGANSASAPHSTTESTKRACAMAMPHELELPARSL